MYICRLPLDAQKYAADELNETEEVRRSGLQELKKWAAENPYLHVKTEEKYILTFLRNCKFDLERTKQKIQNYYITKRDRPEWLANRSPYLSEIRELVKMGCYVVLKQTQENQLVAIMQPMLYDPNVYSIDDFLKTALMIMDIASMEEEIAQVYGLICVVDLRHMSFAHIRKISLLRMKYIAQLFDTLTSSPKRVEFINAPSYINVILNVFKRFISEKMRDRIHVNTDGNASLCNVIDRAILPKDYGGEGETMKALGNYWIGKLTSYNNWFAEDAKYVAD